MAAQNSAASSAAARPLRNGTPVSARAAARKPASNDATDDDAKLELQARLDELQERLQQTERAYTDSQKATTLLQVRFDESLKEQSILEDSLHEHTERVEEMENEKKEGLRARRELEQIYEAERAAAMREKEDARAREEEMMGALQRMKETLAQRELRERSGVGEDDRRHSLSRNSSFRSANASPNPEAHAGGGQFAPPSSLQRSDSRSSSRLVMQKDKIIEGLRLELAEAQIKLVELENKGGGRVHELEKDMYDVKMQNARLMEENESFQLLLSEKTLSGELGQSDLLRPPSNVDSRPASRSPNEVRGTSLADELEGHEGVEGEVAGEGGSAERRLQSEVNGLKDQNKALTLYINNIISRLLQHEQFEQILDKTPDLMAGPGALSRKYAGVAADVDKDLPPPPPVAGEEQQGAGFLQRARSVMGGRPKPRPQSQMFQPNEQLRAEEQTIHQHPDTAPSIPLGRSASTRGHRRNQSDWPAASVVTNMYKGPSPGSQGGGPMSPGLSSPVGGRNSYFSLGVGQRVTSGSAVPTIDEGEGNKGNLPQQYRDSKVLPGELQQPRSNRNSVVSNPSSRPQSAGSGTTTGAITGIAAASSVGGGGGEFSSNPSSPPRSINSSGERENSRGGGGPGGAIMMGSKPRPLRLVQEAQQDDEKVRKAGNRGSWFGWMNKGGASTPGAASSGGGMTGFMGRSVSGGEDGRGASGL